MNILKTGLTIILLILSFAGICQNKNSIEFSFSERYFLHVHDNTRYDNVAAGTRLKLNGKNLDAVIDFKRQFYSKTHVKIGIGYQQFSVNKIENRIGGSDPIYSRRLTYPTTIFIQYVTTKYSFNNLLFHLGLEKHIEISRGMHILVGVDYLHALKLSQKYYIPGIKGNYKPKNMGGFGDLVNMDLALSQKFGRISIAPALVIPVYDRWKRGIVFKEDPDKSITKWFMGLGFKLSVSYH